MSKKKKARLKAVVKSGYGFLIRDNSGQRVIQIMNMSTFQCMYVVAPDSVITYYDLCIFASGFAAGKSQGWAEVI